MTRERVVTVRIDEDQYRGLAAVAERDGVVQSEQIRRAIRAWLDSKGIKQKSERKRASTRERS